MDGNEQGELLPTAAFEDLASLAADCCGVSIGVVLTWEGEKYSVLGAVGMELLSDDFPENLHPFFRASFREETVVQDLRNDPRFEKRPKLGEQERPAFFAGVPFASAAGQQGALCVLDLSPQKPGTKQLSALHRLASQAARLLDLGDSLRSQRLARGIFEEEKSRLFRVIDSAEMGIWELDLESGEFAFNEKWAAILGYSSLELGKLDRKGKEAFIHPQDLSESERALSDYLAGILPRYECELRMKHRKGYWVWILERAELKREAEGGAGRWLFGTLTDNSEQVVAYEQIYLREKKFKILLENSEDAIAILNREGRPHFETESVSRILGLETTPRSAEPIRRLVHPADLEEFDEWFRQALDNPGKALGGNVSRLRHADGSWRHVSGTMTNFFGNPIINGLVYNFKDVSRQVLAEERRRSLENRYRKLAQEGADLVCVIDEEGTFHYLSTNFRHYLGFSEDELEGKNAFGFVHPDDLPWVLEDFAKIKELRQIHGLPYRFKHQEDGWRWVKSVVTNLLDDPDIHGIVINSIDVTAVIDAKKELEQSNERFRLALKAGSESIYDYHPETERTFVSETFEEDFGISLGSMEENFQLIRDRIHPDDLGQAVREFREALENPEVSTWTRQYRLLKGDGTYAHIRDRSIKQTDKSGKPVRVVGALMDTTQIDFFEKLHDIEKEFIESSLVSNTDEKALYRRYLLQLESLIPGMKASILKIEDRKLKNYVSPSLDPGWIRAIEHLDVGPNQGSCGTAAYYGERVLVTDVYEDPRWENYTELARDYGIGACWSFPIFNVEGKVVATIANYYSTPREVGEKEVKTLERAQRLISLLMAQFDYLEKIRLSNERYELVNKSTNEAIFDWDVQKDRFYWGESFTRVFGHDHQVAEFTLETWTNLMHPSDNQEKAGEWEEFIADPQADRWQNQFRFRRKDGSYAFVEESAFIIRDEAGKALRMIGVLRDRTELKRMELLLANASKLSRVGGWEVDVLNDRLLWSPITCEIHEVPIGFTASTAAGIDFYREDFRESVAAMVASTMERGDKFDFEAPIITANGEERWVRAIGEPEFVDDRCVRIFGSIQDIQERKLMEDRLKGVSDSLPGLIFQYILNADGTDEFRYVSRGSIKLLGLSPEECMADSELVWSRLAKGGDLEEVRKSLDESASSLSFWNWEWKVLSPEGKIRWREGRGTPSKRADGSVVWDGLIVDVTHRRNLENLLDQSTKMAKIGSWELDLTLEPIQLNWSSTTRSILGVERLGGMRLEKVYQIFVGQSEEIARQAMEGLIEKGRGFDVELELDGAGGKRRWIRCIGQAVHVKGKTLSAFGSLQDIHERKLSELNLKRLLLERNTILESIGDGFFAVDSNFTVTYWNKQAEKLMKVPRAEILGKNVWDVFETGGLDRFRRKFEQALASGKAVNFEDYLAEFKVWFSVSAFPSDSGLTVFFKDVTQNKNAQEEIRNSNDRFERVSEATNDAIWDAQLSEGKLYWGRGFKSLFGYDLDVFTPDYKFYVDRIHPQDRKRVVGSQERAKANPQVRHWNEEYRFQRADDTYAYVMDRAIFTRNSWGKATRIIGAMADITERREFEESLKKLNVKLKRQAKELAISNSGLEQFAYVASHDLQEPLRMVSSFLSLLDRKYREHLDDKAQQYIHFAVDGAIRMKQIILDLLEYSRVGKGEKELETIHLEDLIFEVSQLQAQLIEEKNATIRFEGIPTLTSFKAPLLQVFQNLIGNALKYSREEEPPLILVSCEEERYQWLLAVKDNGIGVKEEYFDKIFIIFQRLHSKEEYTGTGLGLAIVKKIIDSLGGKIWVESVYSQGTSFYFTIPKPGKKGGEG
ncbi:PAS domain-containing protein [Algoriphagus sp. H41]|uniref:histidine kinase n=1 Tax=Algoriphagus oliviformis TaxID=2811231 RepID=A0ABS3C3J3_9BACT|nr:PAS domain-containing protein [Algoriphagus oliviformis]MBN7811532.1 PAS domain-containing protein [Algoriphagus oliviformis]